MTAAIEQVTLPPLSPLGPEPVLGAEVYGARQAELRARMQDAGIDLVAVYCDREHFATSSHLTGFDPRFEEALVLIDGNRVTILAGNESLSLVQALPGEAAPVLCQAFSLPGQDRSVSPTLAGALTEAGVARSAIVGVIGWKDSGSTGGGVAIPAFVMEALIAHLHTPPVDVTGWLIGLDGQRTVLEADGLALQEHRSARASQHVWHALEALEPGLSELELSVAMRLSGVPHACHVMCTSGAERVNGLRSPTDRPLAYGDRLSMAVGLWGGLCSRAGRVLTHDDPAIGELTERFLAPYVAAERQWYSMLHVGADAGEITEAVVGTLTRSGVRPALNPGHFVHLDEWVNSPFVAGSGFRLRSGTALQCDIIPVGPDPGWVANCEDSLALADGDLRDELRERYPAAWERISARRAFMEQALGIPLSEDVLPFSDRQAALPAGLLSPDHVVR